jgi:hypothetical protein
MSDESIFWLFIALMCVAAIGAKISDVRSRRRQMRSLERVADELRQGFVSGTGPADLRPTSWRNKCK